MMTNLVTKIVRVFLTGVWRLIRKIAGPRGLILLGEQLIQAIENQQKVYITYHYRPAYSNEVLTEGYGSTNDNRVAIVLQGPILGEKSFTLETVKLYQKHFRDTSIILSTWSDENPDYIARFRELEITLILNEKPEHAGASNINYQIISSSAGVQKAKEIGAEYVLKTRTDQRMYATGVVDYFYNICEQFPVTGGFVRQKKRIVGISLNTFKYRMYGLSDMLIYGHVEDMLLYWNGTLDERESPVEVLPSRISLREHALRNICEVYLSRNFLKQIGRNLEWTLQGSWGAFSDNFVVVDKEVLDLLWPKYGRREYFWRSYGKNEYFQEITFNEWLNIYAHFDKLEIPENLIDQLPNC